MLPHHYTRLLQRLLTLVNEIKANPHQSPEALYTALGVSSAIEMGPLLLREIAQLRGLGTLPVLFPPMV